MRKADIVVDISHHQKDNVVKAIIGTGVRMVIIRAGYIGKSGITEDKKFEKFYSEAKRGGLLVGTYFYIYDGARTISPVKLARQIYEMMRTYEFELPIFLDIEDFKRENATANQDWTIRCLNELEKNALFVGIYGSDISTFREMFDDGRAMARRYYSWVARYGKDPQYIVNPPMHQYTDMGKLKDYSGNVDVSYIYDNIHTTIIEGGFNGF